MKAANEIIPILNKRQNWCLRIRWLRSKTLALGLADSDMKRFVPHVIYLVALINLIAYGVATNSGEVGAFLARIAASASSLFVLIPAAIIGVAARRQYVLLSGIAILTVFLFGPSVSIFFGALGVAYLFNALLLAFGSRIKMFSVDSDRNVESGRG